MRTMRTPEEIRLEISRLENTRRLMTERIRVYWKKLDILYEELRLSREGEREDEKN